jgi:pimeloyl-ACP methyl ester carboxylesterase
MFPAGDPRFSATYLPLSLSYGAQTVRVVECGRRISSTAAICVHGWACSAYSFRRLLPLLDTRDMRAVAIELPGHGLSDKPATTAAYTLDVQVECLIAAMDHIGVERAILIGHSMGGAVCARAAVLRPDRVVALALLAPVGFGTEWDMRLLRAITPRWVETLLPYMVHRWMVSAIFASVYGSRYRPTDRDVDEYWAPTQFAAFIPAMWSLLHEFEWDAGENRGFAEIGVPTAVIGGMDDNLVVQRWLRRYATVIRTASLTMVEDCGHVVPEEVPELVASAITGLIR